MEHLLSIVHNQCGCTVYQENIASASLLIRYISCQWALFISHGAVQVLISICHNHCFIYLSQVCHVRVTSSYTSACKQA